MGGWKEEPGQTLRSVNAILKGREYVRLPEIQPSSVQKTTPGEARSQTATKITLCNSRTSFAGGSERRCDGMESTPLAKTNAHRTSRDAHTHNTWPDNRAYPIVRPTGDRQLKQEMRPIGVPLLRLSEESVLQRGLGGAWGGGCMEHHLGGRPG